MRTRNRVQTTVGTYVYDSLYQGQPRPTVYGSKSFRIPLRSFSDQPNPATGFKACDDVRVEYTLPDLSLPMAATNGVQDHMQMYVTSGGLYLGYFDPQGAEVSMDIDWDGACYDLYNQATGVVPTQASLAVNVAEAASLKTLVPSILSGLTGLTKKTKKVLSARSLKDIAGSHLAVEFGLLPLLGDLGKFFNTREVVRNKVNWMKEHEGMPTLFRSYAPVRTTISYPSEPTRVTNPWGSTYAYSSIQCYEATVKTKACVHASARFWLTNDAGVYTRALVSALGLNKPQLIAWELVPFSFVIDWFYPVGDKLDRIRITDELANLTRQCDVRFLGYSIKKEQTEKLKLYLNRGLGDANAHSGPWLYGSRKTTSFFRSPGAPPSGGWTGPSGWSLRRSFLSASLIAQKLIS